MLVERIKRVLLEFKVPRLQESGKSFYSSEICKDARDLYWRRTGEPETNPVDLVGAVRMFIGKSIEDGLNRHIISNMHFFGLHPYQGEEQIRVGFTQSTAAGVPVTVSGKLDGLLVERKGDQFSKQPWVLEIKTKYGAGADFFQRELNPGPEYLAQMGSYLKRASEAGVTNRGMFLFVLIGDRTIGQMWEIHCEYEGGVVTATKAISLLEGETRELNYSYDLNAGLERLAAIAGAAEKKELPPVDKRHKHPVTPESVGAISDTALKAIVAGTKVAGDWQIAYSSYKQKHLALQGAGYTPEEMEILHAEYIARFPILGKKLKAQKAG